MFLILKHIVGHDATFKRRYLLFGPLMLFAELLRGFGRFLLQSLVIGFPRDDLRFNPIIGLHILHLGCLPSLAPSAPRSEASSRHCPPAPSVQRCPLPEKRSESQSTDSSCGMCDVYYLLLRLLKSIADPVFHLLKRLLVALAIRQLSSFLPEHLLETFDLVIRRRGLQILRL